MTLSVAHSKSEVVVIQGKTSYGLQVNHMQLEVDEALALYRALHRALGEAGYIHGYVPPGEERIGG